MSFLWRLTAHLFCLGVFCTLLEYLKPIYVQVLETEPLSIMRMVGIVGLLLLLWVVMVYLGWKLWGKSISI